MANIVSVFILLMMAFGARTFECGENDDPCKIQLPVEPRLTMMDGSRRVMPTNGGLRYYDETKPIRDPAVLNSVLTTDGVYARLVISVNGTFPGPELIMEDQNVELSVTNELHTDSITVHLHGIHQRKTPWMDGVAYITQCPILPGSTFTYKFKASPAGTHWYHAHIGDQRSMGLYGPLIVKKRELQPNIIDKHIIIIQDWNHDMDPETAYQKMIHGIYNCDEKSTICERYKETQTLDGALFSRFELHSGLINGRGRYHYGSGPQEHNGAPLTRFEVVANETYRFRVISAATLYPFRVYVAGHPITIIASDGRGLKPMPVDSFVIQTGERYDFYLETNQEIGDYMIVAESLEVNKTSMHIAEAILSYVRDVNDSSNNALISNERTCSAIQPCLIFNCPYRYYPAGQYRNCTTYNYASGTEDDKDRDEILKAKQVKQFFLNFAFPGEPGNTPGSVNGRQFVSPKVSALTQPSRVHSACSDLGDKCGADKICSCMYTIDISEGDIVELIFFNMGKGRGWSHPIHIHGHSVYVLAYGFPQYDTTTGKYLADNDNVECEDDYCNVAKWRGRQKRQIYSQQSSTKRIPPLKDTMIVPSGGYVITRFKADNPGVWFLHCHIDLHNTNGMAMAVNESFSKHPKPPQGFPVCGDYTDFKLPPVSGAKASRLSLKTVIALLLLSLDKVVPGTMG
ncbi:laccase-2-like [Haliotis rufescens]|uniref:laccase-2-like n=1 Tax=Haliotis rufescens TaxID=6454 RepID=UPI00201EDFEA|nr:laccase-2-like [Haliotis rufescens]XP_046357707.2 laccase-2-like [Haliotis rufescens]